MDKNTNSIIIAVLVTALIAGGGVYWWQSSVLANERERLNNEIADLREQIEEEPTEPETQEPESNQEPENGIVFDDTQISQKPKSGWEEYFPSYDETTLEGKTTEEIRELLGEPPVLVRDIGYKPAATWQIWVYRPFDEDPTGLYLYFKGGELVRSRLDEFSGVPSLLGDIDFWYN